MVSLKEAAERIVDDNRAMKEVTAVNADTAYNTYVDFRAPLGVDWGESLGWLHDEWIPLAVDAKATHGDDTLRVWFQRA